MNIYHVTWTTHGGFGLDAVVIAGSESEAVELLQPESQPDQVLLIGTAVADIEPGVVSQTSL
jgi:hypothetical protein